MTEFGFLLDMDGVIYRGSRLIDGAADFIKLLRRRGIPFLFLTNNSQRARRDVAHKLSKMGIPAGSDDVFTCGIATARYLAHRRPGGTAYVIGENGLTSALFKNGYTVVDDDADFVVVGEGRTLSFEMIEKGVRLVEKGAKLIATNLDPSCPTDKGIRPGCGAIVSMIEKATGKRAFSVGKPSPVMMRAARKQLGLTTDQTVMVGDTMSTDILGGNQMATGPSSSFPAAPARRISINTPTRRISSSPPSPTSRPRCCPNTRPSASPERAGSPAQTSGRSIHAALKTPDPRPADRAGSRRARSR